MNSRAGAQTIPQLVREKHSVSWILPHRKRPFATSTTSTSDLIVLLAEQGGTVSETLAAVNFDSDAALILEFFIDHGYGDVLASDLFISDGRPVDERVPRARRSRGGRLEPGAAA